MAGNGFGFWNTMPTRMRTCWARMPGRVDVLAVEQDLAVERGAGHELVHAVEQPEERRLAAARRADERGDLAGLHHEVDVLEHEVVAEPGARVTGLERRGARRRAAVELDAVGVGSAAVAGAVVVDRRRSIVGGSASGGDEPG